MYEFNFENYRGFFRLTKTLKFSLIPIGNTLNSIKKEQIIEKDKKRHDDAQAVKDILTDFYVDYLNRKLDTIELNPSILYQLYELSMKDVMSEEDKEEYETYIFDLYHHFDEVFKEDSEYKFNKMFSKDVIEKYLPSYVESENDKKLIESFNGFTSYFLDFFKLRRLLFDCTDTFGSASYRVLRDNFPIYLSNLKLFEIYSDEYIEVFNKTNNVSFKNEDIELLSNYLNFSKTICQKGIDSYNKLLTGYSDDKTHHKGLNNLINEYNQKLSINQKDKTLPLFKKLKNQILSEPEKRGYVFEKISDDIDLANCLTLSYQSIQNEIKNEDSWFNYCRNELTDLNGLFIRREVLNNLSHSVYSDWQVIKNSLCSFEVASEMEENEENWKKEFDKRKYFSIKHICDALSFSGYDSEYLTSAIHNMLSQTFFDEKNILEMVQTNYLVMKPILAKADHKKNYLFDNLKIGIMKNYCDSIQELKNLIDLFMVSDLSVMDDANVIFYSKLNELDELMDLITTVYNKTRNYLTQKPFQENKLQLYFGKQNLLNGWSTTKLNDNCGLIFKDGNNYYLGIIVSKYYRDIANHIVPDGNPEEYIQCMKYASFDASKLCPALFITKGNPVQNYGLTPDILDIYANGTFKKGNNFNLEDCHKLIDYYKHCLAIYYPERKAEWTDTSYYSNIGEFFAQAKKEMYICELQYMSRNYIETLIEDGKMYYFQIYNKDFSPAHHGNDEIPTKILKSLFTLENQNERRFALNGGASIYYRPASLSLNDTAIHKAGVPMRNKRIGDGKSRILNYDVIKNQRYTEDKFFFHFSVTINPDCSDNFNLNPIINEDIKLCDSYNVIGIKRGEHNLLVATVINNKGEILEEHNFNVIDSVRPDGTVVSTDYRTLLDEKQKARNKQRRSWTSIETIKNLKSGYLSYVMHEIGNLVLKYKAFIVIENLNSDFKSNRMPIEKQIYQNFELSLYHYLSNFQIDNNIMNAIQLSNSVDSLSKVYIQNGIVFNVNPSYTVNIDPITGFYCPISWKYQNIKKSKEFIHNLDSFQYDRKNDVFFFDIDYVNYFNKKEVKGRSSWRIYTHGDRLKSIVIRNTNKRSFERIWLTDEFKSLFEEYEINYRNHLKEQILAVDGKDFYVRFMELMSLTLQIRNNRFGSDEDYIISPVMQEDHSFYDSRICDGPSNASFNGSYNLARKGSLLIEQIRNSSDKLKFDLKTETYLNFIQT